MSKDQEHKSEGEAADKENDKRTQLDPVIEGLTTITKEIRHLKKKVKEDLLKFKNDFKEEVKCEFAGFKEEKNWKVAQNIVEIQQQR